MILKHYKKDFFPGLEYALRLEILNGIYYLNGFLINWSDENKCIEFIEVNTRNSKEHIETLFQRAILNKLKDQGRHINYLTQAIYESNNTGSKESVEY